jgi:hypothetical protein
MIRNVVNSKTFQKIYGIVFPVIVIALVIGIASLNTSSRTIILGSIPFDFVIRTLLSIWFSALFIRLSRFSTYRVYSNKQWTKADVGKSEQYYLIGLAVLFSIGCGILAYWVTKWLFPGIGNFTFVIALINGLIVLLPMATQYWILKL